MHIIHAKCPAILDAKDILNAKCPAICYAKCPAIRPAVFDAKCAVILQAKYILDAKCAASWCLSTPTSVPRTLCLNPPSNQDFEQYQY